MLEEARYVSKRIFRTLLTNLLPLSIHWRMACARGWLYRKAHGVPDEVRANLHSVFGNLLESSEIDAIAHRNVELTNRLVPLKDILPRMCEPDTRFRWNVVGLEFLDECLAAGQGAILLTAHLGYSKFVTPILRSYGYDVKSVVARSIGSLEEEARLAQWLQGGGIIRGCVLRLLAADHYRNNCIAAQLDVRPMFRALHENKPILIAGDGLKAAEFTQLPLLGGSYPFAKGFMKIAMKMGTPILPTFALDGEGGYWISVKIARPLEVDRQGSIEGNLLKYAQMLDEQIRRSPHLWYRWAVKDALEKIAQLPEGTWVDRWNQGAGLSRKAAKRRSSSWTKQA